MHWPAIADIDGMGPYFTPSRVVHIGHRDDDEEAEEAHRSLGLVISAGGAITTGPASMVSQVSEVAGEGYWLQVDVDVLDPTVMPAVDSPDPGGLDAEQLIELLDHLAPQAIGASVTVFDPDLDPDGQYARVVTDVIAKGLHRLGRDVLPLAEGHRTSWELE
ncbi:arginase family enzyme [Nesterenkonia halotolerans]|uniref:Arginase family enzyme n=2 Tax=Nesterenkonia halotolerans TaxID=225325 RepID=A0ABR9J3Z8_9MICC|nr:arginase family enzyme [Nesterenkonia halotolerans]